MNYRNTLALLAGIAIAGVAWAGARHGEMSIAIVTDDGEGESRIELDSEDLGFNLHDLQVGENRSVTDKQGRAVLITREEDGFRFDVDGESVTMPLLHEPHGKTVWVEKSGVDGENVEVLVTTERHGPRPGHGRRMKPMDGTTILSAEPIDAATQASIKSLLESAGHDGEVRFIERGDGPGDVLKLRKVERRVQQLD